MRNFKKFLTLVLAVMMVVSAMSFTTSAAVTKFEDVSADNDYLAEAVDLLNYVGVAKGVSETKFGTDELVTRQQFALFMYRLMKGGKDAPATGANSTKFTDLVDPTYNFAISWAYQNGIINGRTATTFDPTGAITLQDAYTMIVRALDYEADGEKLPYPFGYIEVAEKDEVDLAEGLASTVDYLDALTRGDMAILLYNAFFAETGVAEIKYDEIHFGSNDYLIEKEYFPILCEKSFDVQQAIYQVVATPHYELVGSGSIENTSKLGYDAVVIEQIDDDNVEKGPSFAYVTPEDLGITAKELDDQFLAHYTIFYTLKEEDNKNVFDAILYADSNKVVKTVNEIKFETFSSNKQDSYFAGTKAKSLTGKAIADNEVFYFYNAPYSYAAPTYPSFEEYQNDVPTATAADYQAHLYALRNDQNIGTIDFAHKGNYEDGIFAATTDEIKIETVYNPVTDTVDMANGAALPAEVLAATYELAYYDGLYEADLYDMNGDGIYDYIDYKEYELFQIDTDDEKEFTIDCDPLAPTVVNGLTQVYTNKAEVIGEKANDEDVVIGYYDVDTNVVKIAEVIKPVTSTIKSYNSGEKTLVLADGTKVDAASYWTLVSNYVPSKVVKIPGNPTAGIDPVYYGVQYDVKDGKENLVEDPFNKFEDLTAANQLGESIDFYLRDGVLLYQVGAKSKALQFTENLIIPVPKYSLNANGITLDASWAAQETFDKETGAEIDYIYAWVDGELKWVPVAEDEDHKPAVVDAAGNVAAEYQNELCTYAIDSEGNYTITSLLNSKDIDGNNNGINYKWDPTLDTNGDGVMGEWVATTEAGILEDDKEEGQYLVNVAGPAYLRKYAGTRYSLTDNTFATDLLNYKLNFTEFSKIIINNYIPAANSTTGHDEYQYIELDYTTLATSDTDLYNVNIVLSNDIDSKVREDVVVFYAEATNFDLKGATTNTGYKVVMRSDVRIDEDDYYRNYYTVFDPATGKIESDVPGTFTAAKASGMTGKAMANKSLTKLKGGKVDDKSGLVFDASLNANETAGLKAIASEDLKAGYVWIVEYDAKDKVMLTTDVLAAGNCWQDAEVAPTTALEVNNNTVVTLYKGGAINDIFLWGSSSLRSIDDLGSDASELRCYNTEVKTYKKDQNGAYIPDDDKDFRTGYAKYIKAYVVATDDAAASADPDDLDKALLVVITVHGDEDESFLQTHTETLHTVLG